MLRTVKSEADQALLHKALDRSRGRAKGLRGLSANRDSAADEFADRYERLMSLLCDAAKNGCRPRLENEYGDIRRWLLDRRTGRAGHPAFRLSPAPGVHGGADDPLIQIVGPATLADLLASDTGELIERISQVSEAVFEYCSRLQK
jgi:hypothetical protein